MVARIIRPVDGASLIGRHGNEAVAVVPPIAERHPKMISADARRDGLRVRVIIAGLALELEP